MTERRTWKGCAAPLFLCALCLLGGCNRQQKTDTGKTYTSDQKAGQAARGGAENSGGSQSDAKPLDAPADTTNGRASQDSDSGTTGATHNQVVSQPGAPPEHKPR